MLKNNKGVTILALVITIILLLILAGVSVNTGFSVVKDVRVGRMLSNMALVQAKVEVIGEEYHFHNNDTDYLVGEEVFRIDSATHQLENIKLSDEERNMIAQKAEVSEADLFNWEWFKWDANILEAQGLDKKMLDENEFFYVNYEHAEIVSSEGTSYDNTHYFYSITGLNNLYQNK